MTSSQQQQPGNSRDRDGEVIEQSLQCERGTAAAQGGGAVSWSVVAALARDGRLDHLLPPQRMHAYPDVVDVADINKSLGRLPRTATTVSIGSL